MKKILVAVLACLVLTACSPWELNQWGAQLRGAPVTYVGGSTYVTGGATYPLSQCTNAFAWLEPQINPDTAWAACQVNRHWTWGDLGFTTNTLH